MAILSLVIARGIAKWSSRCRARWLKASLTRFTPVQSNVFGQFWWMSALQLWHIPVLAHSNFPNWSVLLILVPFCVCCTFVSWHRLQTLLSKFDEIANKGEIVCSTSSAATTSSSSSSSLSTPASHHRNGKSLENRTQVSLFLLCEHSFIHPLNTCRFILISVRDSILLFCPRGEGVVLVYHDHLPMDSIVFARRLMNTFLRCFVLVSLWGRENESAWQKVRSKGEGRKGARKESCCWKATIQFVLPHPRAPVVWGAWPGNGCVNRCTLL